MTEMDELAARAAAVLQRTQDGIGTLPARESVKLRPRDWHACEDLLREITRRPSLSPAGVTAQPKKTGWLCEWNLRSGPEWWSLTDTEGEGGYFTKDSTKALRFARKEDAEAYINDAGWTEIVATEHEWADYQGEGK